MATLGNTVVMFGGEYAQGSNYVLLDDTWVWDGTSWAKQAGAGPSGRLSAAMATLGDKVVLFGGNDASGALDDTWVWDGTSWNKQASSGGPSARLRPRHGSALGVGFLVRIH